MMSIVEDGKVLAVGRQILRQASTREGVGQGIGGEAGGTLLAIGNDR